MWRDLGYPLSGVLSQDQTAGKEIEVGIKEETMCHCVIELESMKCIQFNCPPQTTLTLIILIDHPERDRGKNLYTGFHPFSMDQRFAPEYMNAHIFLGFTNVIEKCSQWHPSKHPLVTQMTRDGNHELAGDHGQVYLGWIWQWMSTSPQPTLESQVKPRSSEVGHNSVSAVNRTGNRWINMWHFMVSLAPLKPLILDIHPPIS